MEASFKLVFEDVEVRPLRLRDWRQLEAILQAERKWLEPWEATVPGGSRFLDVKGMVRNLLRQHRDGSAIAAIIEYRGKMVGQLNVANILYGSVSSGSIGYWVSEKCAGKGITPAAVALIVDYMFTRMGLHRAEIAIRVFLRPVLIFYGIIGLVLLLLGILAGFPFFIVPLLLILVVVGSTYFTLRWTKLIIRNNLANSR